MLDRALELVRLEAERALSALKGDPTVTADQVQAIGPAPVRRGDGVVDAVDHHRHLEPQAHRTGRSDRPPLLIRPRLVDGNPRPAILGNDPAILGVRLADVDDQEVDAVAIPPRQLLERPNLGAERRSRERPEDQRRRPLPQEGGETDRALAVDARKLEIRGRVALCDLRRPEIEVIGARHDVPQRQG